MFHSRHTALTRAVAEYFTQTNQNTAFKETHPLI